MSIPEGLRFSKVEVREPPQVEEKIPATAPIITVSEDDEDKLMISTQADFEIQKMEFWDRRNIEATVWGVILTLTNLN